MDYHKNQTRNNQINLFLIEATKNAAQKWPELMVTICLLLVARADYRQACPSLEMFYIAGLGLFGVEVFWPMFGMGWDSGSDFSSQGSRFSQNTLPKTMAPLKSG